MVDLLNLHIKEFVDEAVLLILLLPSRCLSPKLLLYQPLEEVVEVLLDRLWDEFRSDHTIQLGHEGKVVRDDIDCPVDWIFVLSESIGDMFVEG